MVGRAVVAAFWLTVIGLACVYLEFARIRIGHRIYRNLGGIEETRGRLRSLEMEYDRLAGPDALEKEIEEFIGERGQEIAAGT